MEHTTKHLKNIFEDKELDENSVSSILEHTAKHLKNIFEDKELDENSVSAKFAHTVTDCKKYQTNYYNLDATASA